MVRVDRDGDRTRRGCGCPCCRVEAAVYLLETGREEPERYEPVLSAEERDALVRAWLAGPREAGRAGRLQVAEARLGQARARVREPGG